MNDPLRIMVVDDHPVFRLGLVALLTSIAGLEVVVEADSLASAIDAIEHHDVDVVMMDLNLGLDSGVEATREIVARRPDVGVLVVTMVDDSDTVFAAMRAGARGYLLKGAGPVEIERALRQQHQATARGCHPLEADAALTLVVDQRVDFADRLP